MVLFSPSLSLLLRSVRLSVSFSFSLTRFFYIHSLLLSVLRSVYCRQFKFQVFFLCEDVPNKFIVEKKKTAKTCIQNTKHKSIKYEKKVNMNWHKIDLLNKKFEVQKTNNGNIHFDFIDN